MDSLSVPAINHGRYSVHTVDSFHKGGGDSSREEVDEGVFMGDFAEGDVVFELGDVVFFVTEVVVSHAIASFLMSMWINDVLKSSWKAVHVPSDGVESERAFLVKVDAQMVADPSFMKDRVKVIVFSLVS